MRKLVVVCAAAAFAACGPSVKTITVDPSSAAISAKGGTATLKASPKNEKGEPVAEATIQWSSSDASVATVDGKGAVTALKSGETTITAAVGEVKGAARVVVSIPASIAVTPAAVEIKGIGQTANISVTVLDESGKPAPVPVAWSTSNDKVATVANGIVTSRGVGTAVLTASVNNVRGQTSVTVKPLEFAKVVVEPAKPVIEKAGDSLQLKAKAVDAKNAEVVGVLVEWSSADAKIATVTPAGLVTAVKKGKVKLTAKAGEKVATVDVVIKK